jgi:hypothetical protein
MGFTTASHADVGPVRTFADRPVAWEEHDDGNIQGEPEKNHVQELELALTMRDGLANEIDRILSLDSPSPALDVNAADEVPCSTWYCARNHLHPLTPAELVAGAPSSPPKLPFTITKGKDEGSAIGFQVLDADGRKYLLKLDEAGHQGIVTGTEMVGAPIFHAAGYNVPGAHLIEFAPTDLKIGPHATYLLYGVQSRPVTPGVVRRRLAKAARLPDGRMRGVAIPWIAGDVLGSFDMIGTRPGDPNDRIPHERRRSLRASWVLFAWLSILDPGAINTIDTVVDVSGRRFVRHNLIDFSCTFGSATNHVQGLHQDGEYLLEVGRTLGAVFSFGLYQRPFQRDRAAYELMTNNYRAVGYFPAETFDPDTYRSNRKNPSFMRMTDRDAYWGAKIVTSFTDAQIAALIAAARLGEPDATYATHALEVRRDIIGRRYLRAMAAVEAPQVSVDGASVCFDDLAVLRGYVQPAEARYDVDEREVGSSGAASEVTRFERAIAGPHTCVPVGGASANGGYRVVEIRTRLPPKAGSSAAVLTKASRVHLRWRASERRFVVVGLERDE